MDPPTPSEADRLARRVLTTRLALQPKENVTIETYPTALPWAAGFLREARRMGARPLIHYEDENSYWAGVKDGSAAVIGSPGTHEWAELAETDVYIYFWGPEDQPRFNSLPDATAGKLVAFNSRWYRTAAKAGVRGARMGIARVTEANARHWRVSAEAWRKEVVEGSMIDPRQFTRTARKLVSAFERGKEVQIRHPNGTDLTLGLAGRAPLSALGVATPATRRSPFGFMANVPDGSVYVAVDETRAEGTLVSNRMTAPAGEPVRGGRWMFRGGHLVEQSYGEGAASVRKEYASARTGRDLPAMLEVGLDPSVRIAPNLEENERGAVSVGVGSNVGFGGKTRSSFIAHLTVAGANLTIDGRTIVRAGRIV